MPNVDVSIKNIPLSYLKHQNQSFFGSDDYTAAMEVFNKYKLPNATSSESGDSLDKAILPIPLLREVLVAKYTDTVYETKTDIEADDLVFIKLSGKTASADEFTARKFINKCSIDITETNGFLARSVMSNTLVRAAVKAKTNLPVSAVGSDILAAILKPSNTSDPVYDVANKAKFYARTLHPDVYDDKAYAESVYKRIAANITLSITSVPLNNLKVLLDTQYVTKNTDNLRACDTLIERLLYKYFSRDRVEDKLNWGIENFNDETIYNRALKNIEISLATKDTSLRLNIFKEVSVSANNSYMITHNKGLTKYRIAAYNLLGTDVTPRIVATEAIDENTVYVEFDTPIAGSILLLFDSFQQAMIETTSFNSYEKLLTASIFNQFIINTETSKAVIYLDNFNIDYAFIEVRQFETQTPVVPTKIQFFSNRLELTFERDYTNVQVYILPTYQVMIGSNNIRVNPKTIKTFLNTFDVFAENVTIWRA